MRYGENWDSARLCSSTCCHNCCAHHAESAQGQLFDAVLQQLPACLASVDCAKHHKRHVSCAQVAQWIGERLADPYRFKHLVTDNDMPLAKEHQPAGISDR